MDNVDRPFRILGIQQVAIGGPSKARLRALWVDLFGLEVTGEFRWVELGAGSASGGGIGGGLGSPERPSLAIDPDGKPIVAWEGNLSMSREIYVKRWNDYA